MTLKELRDEISKIDRNFDNCTVFVTDSRNGVSDYCEGIYSNQYLPNRGTWDGVIVEDLEHGDMFVEITIG
jgi:hypothetical protein